ncbi:MAG TPA: DUF4149 domain-containing protein [Candidatus Angelobacter sp.]|nr:DUF4149 domain-containing protein [Candidatus Angelobacter sp.]
MWILRAIMLLALVIWIGGIIFFSFVTAPVLFTTLPSTRMAGDVVSVVLGRLHAIGLIAGVVFLVCSIAYNRMLYAQLRLISATHVLLVLMLVMTAISRFSITAQMRDLRNSPGALESSAARDRFNSLHVWSTRLEGGTLFLGLVAVVMTARRNPGS